MFISNEEKERIAFRLAQLEEQVRDLTMKVVMMNKFPEAQKKRSRNQSEESRKAQSERMKKYWADKKGIAK